MVQEVMIPVPVVMDPAVPFPAMTGDVPHEESVGVPVPVVIWPELPTENRFAPVDEVVEATTNGIEGVLVPMPTPPPNMLRYVGAAAEAAMKAVEDASPFPLNS